MTPERREAKRVYDAAWRKEHPEYSAAYYSDHREEALARNAARYEANRDSILEKEKRERVEFTERLQILRTVNGCEDCETHKGLLDHHHVDPSTKKFNVSDMYSYSLDRLEEELEMCVVLCRSCHKKRHVAMRAL